MSARSLLFARCSLNNVILFLFYQIWIWILIGHTDKTTRQDTTSIVHLLVFFTLTPPFTLMDGNWKNLFSVCREPQK
jgi:hypothetical protein